jgi:hypothetical protein
MTSLIVVKPLINYPGIATPMYPLGTCPKDKQRHSEKVKKLSRAANLKYLEQLSVNARKSERNENLKRQSQPESGDQHTADKKPRIR